MMKRWIAVVGCLGIAAGAWGAPSTEAPTTDGAALVGVGAADGRTVAASLKPYVDAGAVAGAVSMVSVSGRVETVYVGLADPRTGRAYDVKTLFWIASMTKGFCGAAVMACVDRGLLALDDPVEKYVPEMANVKVGEKQADGTVKLRAPKKKMTLRMCLSHVAGYPFSLPDTQKAGSDLFTLEELAKKAAAFPLLRDLETKHQYSNVDINLAGRCVEVVSGERFDAFLQKTILDPLGMKDTTFFPTREQMSHCTFVSRVRVDGRYEDGSNDHWARPLDPDRICRPGRHAIPAGGLYATAADVMKFYQMLANDGCAPDGTRILSHASIVQLSTAQYPALDRYSLGLRQFGDWFGHDGALQTEAYANWKENRACLLFVQITGKWNHPFKLAWRRAAGVGR